MGVFAATYPILIIPACLAHWVAMLAWLIVQKTKACTNQCEEVLFNLIVAFIYIFCFFNVREEPTRYKYLTYYMVCFMENSVLLFTWFFSFNLSTPEILWFRISGLVGDYSLFFLGILCMVLYYVYFHPTVGSMSQKQNHPPTKAPSAASIHFPSDHVPNKLKSLTRKGSIDTTLVVVTNNATIGQGSSNNATRRRPPENFPGPSSTSSSNIDAIRKLSNPQKTEEKIIINSGSLVMPPNEQRVPNDETIL